MSKSGATKTSLWRIVTAMAAAAVIVAVAQSVSGQSADAGDAMGTDLRVGEVSSSVAADLVPEVEAPAYAVFDTTTGKFSAGRDLHGRRSVGSLMKLLTARVAMDAGNFDREVVVPRLSTRPDESAIGLIAGERQRRDVLLRAMLIVSANDAARALAVDIGGGIEEFADQMNATAHSLAMAETHAVDPAGLDAPAQYSSAHDMALLADNLMRDDAFREIVARRDARLHGKIHRATNDLLGAYDGADGVKTGYTGQAGWCLVSSASREGRRIVAVVLGAPTEQARDRDSTRLLDWGFELTG